MPSKLFPQQYATVPDCAFVEPGMEGILLIGNRDFLMYNIKLVTLKPCIVGDF